MRSLTFAFATLAFSTFAFAQSQSFSSLEERMTAKDFREAGLDKLSDEELRTLNAWIERNVRLADPALAAQAAAAPVAPGVNTDTVGFENARRDKVVSRINGTFKGWFGKTEFVLDNGQVWQQTEEDRFPFTAESPEVTITPGAFGSWRLKVEGANRSTLVKRIR